MGLTRRQRDLLDFIGAYMATENVAPSFEEMKNGIGLKSKSGIHRLIHSLEERGFINRLPYRNRAIEILQPVSPRLTKLAPRDQRPLGKVSLEKIIEELCQRGVAFDPDDAWVIWDTFEKIRGLCLQHPGALADKILSNLPRNYADYSERSAA